METIFQADVKSLLPDWQQRWQTYWSIIKPHAGSILAFYPMDEPPAPDIPIAATVSPSIIRGLEFGAYDLPPEVTWVGFDSCESSSLAQGALRRQDMRGMR